MGANSEIDYYLGYRGEAGAYYYDVGYGYYTYPGASEYNAGEILVSGGVGLSDAAYVTATFGFDPKSDVLDSSISFDYYGPLDGLSLNATYGEISDGGRSYWSVGASYAFNDTFSADLTWQDTNITEGVVVLAVSTAFDLR